MNNQFGLNGALRNDPNLARYVVTGQPTGMQLGSGSYGTVEEVKIKLICCHESLCPCDLSLKPDYTFVD